MFTPVTIRKTVFHAVCRLAASFEEQLVWLDRYPVIKLPVDELAIDFGEHLLVVHSNTELRTKFSDDEIKFLTEIDNFLDNISGEQNKSLWTLEALENSSERRHVRECANYLKDIWESE